MLLASCDQTKTPSDTKATETTGGTETETESETETEKETNPVDEEVNYGLYIGQWTKYLAYANEDDGRKPNASFMFSAGDSTTEYCRSNAWIITCNKTEGGRDYDGNIRIQKEYCVYSRVTGEKLRSFSTGYYSSEENGRTIDINKIGDCSGFFEVKEGDYINLGTYEEPNYAYKYTYSYYSPNGTRVAGGLDKRSYTVKSTASGAELVTIGDKCYFCRDDEIVYTFEKGQERDIPNIESDDGLECGDYKYYYDSYGKQLTVFDDKYDVICSFKLESGHDNCSWWVLESGDVLIQYADECYTDDYDFKLDDDSKVAFRQIVVHINDGTVEETESPEYYIFDVVTKYSSGYTYKVKDENESQLVIAHKVDSKLSDDVRYLIMDNSLKVIAELPNIVKNQVGFVGFVSENKMIVKAANYSGDQYIYYMVDTRDSTVSLYVDEQSSEYEKVDGGFIYKGILYNYDMKELCDLSCVESYEIVEGVIIVNEKLTRFDETETASETETDDESDINTVTSEYSISVYYIADGQVCKNFVCYDTYDYDVNGSLIFVSDNTDHSLKKVYSLYGELLVSADSVSVNGNIIVGKKVQSNGIYGEGDTVVRYYYILK